MRIPRQSTLENGIGFKNIPKYEAFFKKCSEIIDKSPHKQEYRQLIRALRFEDSKTILSNLDDGYCPSKGERLNFTYARVIMMNIDLLYEIGSKEAYLKFIKKVKS